MNSYKFILLLIPLCLSGYIIKADPPAAIRNINHMHSHYEALLGEYGIWYKTSGYIKHDTNRISKPFIIIEGWDPLHTMHLDDIYKSMNGSLALLDNLRCNGYDIIILNLLNGNKEIEKNARLLAKLINNINLEVTDNHLNYGSPVHRPHIMGISMGGLIARYCLAEMEKTNSDHKVETYISFDTPHKGANIPLGFLHLADQIMHPLAITLEARALIPSPLKKLDPSPLMELILQEIFDIPYSPDQPAALQMLANYVRPNYTRYNFLQNLHSVGNYPSKVWRRVAISNGSNGINQNGISPNTKILELRNTTACLINRSVNMPLNLGQVHIKYCPVTASAEAYAMSDPPPDRVIASMGFDIQPMLFSPTIRVANSQKISKHDILNAPSVKSIDHVPGGKYTLRSIQELANTINSAQINIPIQAEYNINMCIPAIKINWFKPWKSTHTCEPKTFRVFSINENITINRPFGTMSTVPQFSFVPTISGLDIATTNWHYNLNMLSNYPKRNNTPFDAIYWNSTNSYHAFLPEAYEGGLAMANFVKEELSPTTLYIQNRVFPQGYQNTFSAHHNIVLGNNVDQVQGRSTQGNVTFENNSNILLVTGNGFIYFDDGVDISGGNIETGTYTSCNNNAFSNSPAPPINMYQLRNPAVEAESNDTPESNFPAYGTAVYDNPTFYDIALMLPPSSSHNNNESMIDIITTSAHPNPFSEQVNITYTLGYTGKVKLTLHNLMGTQIATLVDDEIQNSGNYRYTLDGTSLPSGTYFYTIKHNTYSTTQKLILMR